MESRIKNWTSDKHGYIFTFALGREAIGVRVNIQGGTCEENEEEKLWKISDTIVENGVSLLNIESGSLDPITVDDYLSDKYVHPADEMSKHVNRFTVSQHAVAGIGAEKSEKQK